MNYIKCDKCGNTDPSLFGLKNGKYYCRACNKYNGQLAHISKYIKPKLVHAKIDYKLSKSQEEISKIVESSDKEIYVDAVCGSGKTEIVFASIEKAISLGQRVGFVIPRREVVKEIYDRLRLVYPSLNIVSVYGGHNEYLDGDIICLTAHQCYRYKDKFGLVILDEYDAFPLKGDNTLLNLIKNSTYNKIIYLSATFSKEFLSDKNYVSLNRRHHNQDLPLPKIEIVSKLSMFFKLLNFIKLNKNNPLFIFVSTIKEGEILRKKLNLMLIKTTLFTSKSKDKGKMFNDIKLGIKKLVITTTILERGITVSNLNVVIYKADHKIFDSQTLIQICGRVGRKKDCPTGKILFLANKKTSSITKCLNEIYDKNSHYS